MQIPQKLLSLSDHQLRETLTDNIFKSRYVIDTYNGRPRIIEIEGKIGKHFFYMGGERQIHYSLFQDKNCYNPLTIESLQRFRRENIVEKVNDWSQETFQKWCLTQFNSVYGSEFVDLYKGYITVRFPEMTISNTMEQTHLMRDIYLKFSIGDVVRLWGMKRGTMTDVEIRNYYTFSHTNNDGDVFNWSTSFCFGETPIATLKGKVSSSRVKCVQNLRFFLEAIKEYLSWESLEGVPYNKIDNVLYDKKMWKNVYCPSFSCDNVYKTVLEQMESFQYDFICNEDSYQISLKPESKANIDTILEAEFPQYMFSNVEGNAVEKNTIVQDEYKYPNHVWFKGQYVPFTMISTEDEVLEPEKKIHPEMAQYVYETIERKFNQYLKQKKINDYNQ